MRCPDEVVATPHGVNYRISRDKFWRDNYDPGEVALMR